MCKSCGHIGRCDATRQPARDRPFGGSGHPIIRSAEPGEDWSWCLVDELAFVLRRRLTAPRRTPLEATRGTASVVSLARVLTCGSLAISQRSPSFRGAMIFQFTPRAQPTSHRPMPTAPMSMPPELTPFVIGVPEASTRQPTFVPGINRP